MIKTITKKQIIKALQTEPELKRRFWFHDFPFKRSDTDLKKPCAVCVVGCILRAMSFEAWAKKRHYSLTRLGNASAQYVVSAGSTIWKERTDSLLKDKNYLAALSMYFESDHDREKCIKFVEQNFPSKLIVRIFKSDFCDR